MIHDERNCSFIHHRIQQGFISIKLEIDIKGEKGCSAEESLSTDQLLFHSVDVPPMPFVCVASRMALGSVRVLVECAGGIVFMLEKMCKFKIWDLLSLNFLIAHPQR